MHNCECGKFEEITRDVPLGPMIHQIDRLMFRNLSSRVRAEGLDEVTLMHGWVMRYLYENRDRVICQKDIEHTFDIRRSTVTNIIQLMEKKGYVERRSVPGDARLKCVSLTAKGEENHLQMEHLISMLEKEQVIDITEEELDSLDIVVGDERTKATLRRIISEQVEGIYLTSSVPTLLEISDEKAGKATALAFLADYLQIPQEATVAFGNAENDIDMICWAGIGVAVENSPEEVRRAADEITRTNDADGVARWIERKHQAASHI